MEMINRIYLNREFSELDAPTKIALARMFIDCRAIEIKERSMQVYERQTRVKAEHYNAVEMYSKYKLDTTNRAVDIKNKHLEFQQQVDHRNRTERAYATRQTQLATDLATLQWVSAIACIATWLFFLYHTIDLWDIFSRRVPMTEDTPAPGWWGYVDIRAYIEGLSGAIATAFSVCLAIAVFAGLAMKGMGHIAVGVVGLYLFRLSMLHVGLCFAGGYVVEAFIWHVSLWTFLGGGLGSSWRGTSVKVLVWLYYLAFPIAACFCRVFPLQVRSPCYTLQSLGFYQRTQTRLGSVRNA
eukprot:TRINITY_DN3954_c0_g1_i1.p1 TRINITY_DN3954_c0_g1~~TRINITY_DN3954_c0_g1_i1.p1  ORF type:complete len:307 (-),score=36.73 TRINITY_DN3954_c0_g1_i1:62-952(-)